MQRHVGPSRFSSYAQLSILLAVAFVAMTVLAFWLARETDRATDEVKILRRRIWNTTPWYCAYEGGCIWEDGQWKLHSDAVIKDRDCTMVTHCSAK